MPQMMPLNWLTLMIFFLLLFYLFNSLNYFSFLYMNKNKMIKMNKLSLNWKW